MTGGALPPEGWEEPIPERTRLHQRPPTAAGSGLVAGLASHLMELAAEYELPPGVLLLESVGPVLGRPDAFGPNDRDGHYFSRFLSESPWSVNGSGDVARLLAYAVGELTGDPALERSTAVPLGRVLPAKGLIRRAQAFCVDCFALWKGEGRPIYHPLVWSFREITHCGIHGTTLRTRCPREGCGTEQSTVTYFGRPGFCQRPECGRFLGRLPGRTGRRRGEDGSGWGVWVWGQVSRLIAATQEGFEPSGEGIADAIERLIAGSSAGNGAAFGRSVSATKSVVCDWRSGRVLPTLGHALRVCAVGGVELASLLAGRLEPAVLTLDGPIPPLREAHRPIAWDSLALVLAARTADRSGPVEPILRDFRADRRAVRRRLGPTYAEAVDAASDGRRVEASARAASEATRVRRAVAACLADGETSAKAKVQRRAGLQIRRPRAVDSYREAVREQSRRRARPDG